ncbi:MAG: hypothetical protein KDK97_15690, partial [Verrucomicrobiales bacterium]|nr:hypothetical protein [Verrucomicrobiales bacterium]
PSDRNITGDLIQQGTDTLKAVTGFAHDHGMESFWSMRMNDTHDVAHKPETPYFLFPQFKMDHPELLVGDPVKRTPFGRWSSVDYARAEIRDLAFQFIEEVCLNYDVDGVELDFFRHLCYFKSVANGGKATAEEVAVMTALMRRIRTMTEEIGLKRGRPILVMMRVPDSTQFSIDSGLDIATWLKDGLLDILITTDYFRLNPWEHSVQLGHPYGVKVYPALTDPRVRHETRFKRHSESAYRGRAAVAWAAGADGLYLFNLYDIDRQSPLWYQLGDPEALAGADKLYFVTDLDGKPTSWLAKGDQYQTISVLTPTYPQQLHARQTYRTQLTVADDFSSGKKATATLHLDTPGIDSADRLEVSVNGTALTGLTLANGWIDAAVPTTSLKKGANEIAITLLPAKSKTDESWTLAYDGSVLPDKPWRRDPGSSRVEAKVQEGALLIADRGVENGDSCYYRASWGADPLGETVVEGRAKVVSGNNFFIFANGVSGERLQLSPDGIALYHHPKIRYAMNTTDDFHHYRLVLKGADLQVYVDGTLRLDAPGALTPRKDYPRNEIAFGAANSPGLGEALWDDVRFHSARVDETLQDIALSIDYPED